MHFRACLIKYKDTWNTVAFLVFYDPAKIVQELKATYIHFTIIHLMSVWKGWKRLKWSVNDESWEEWINCADGMHHSSPPKSMNPIDGHLDMWYTASRPLVPYLIYMDAFTLGLSQRSVHDFGENVRMCESYDQHHDLGFKSWINDHRGEKILSYVWVLKNLQTKVMCLPGDAGGIELNTFNTIWSNYCFT